MRHSAQMLQSKPSTGSLETFGTGDVVYLQIIHISSLEFHPSFCPSFWPLLRLADRLLLSSSANPSMHFCILSSLNLSESCQYSTCRHWCHEKLTAFLLNGGQGFLMPPPWEIIRALIKRWCKMTGRPMSESPHSSFPFSAFTCYLQHTFIHFRPSFNDFQKMKPALMEHALFQLVFFFSYNDVAL